MNDKERNRLLSKICSLSDQAGVPADHMNSIQSPSGYILTITSLCTRDEDACCKLLESLKESGLTVYQSHPVSVRTVHVYPQQAEEGK